MVKLVNYDLKVLLCNKDLLIRAFYGGFNLDEYQWNECELVKDCRNFVELEILWESF